MGAVKQNLPMESDADSIENRYGARSVMFNTNGKKSIGKKQNERVLRKKFEKKKPRLSTFRAIVIAFIIGVLCVGQYGLIQDMGLRINEQQIALNELVAENEALRQQSAALSNRSVVKEKAQKELGMYKAEEVIVYTPSVPQGE